MDDKNSLNCENIYLKKRTGSVFEGIEFPLPKGPTSDKLLKNKSEILNIMNKFENEIILCRNFYDITCFDIFNILSNKNIFEV